MWFLWDFEWKRLYILLFFISYRRDPNFKNWNCFWFPLPSESLKVWEFELPNPLWYSAFFKYPVFSNVLIKIQNEKKRPFLSCLPFQIFIHGPYHFPVTHAASSTASRVLLHKARYTPLLYVSFKHNATTACSKLLPEFFICCSAFSHILHASHTNSNSIYFLIVWANNHTELKNNSELLPQTYLQAFCTVNEFQSMHE